MPQNRKKNNGEPAPQQNETVKIIMIGVILGLITLITALMLSALNGVTKPVIDRRAAAEKLESVKAFFGENVSAEPAGFTPEDPVTEIMTVHSSGGNIIGYSAITEPKGFAGRIKIFAAFGTDGKIQGVKVLSMTETAGIGTKTADDAFTGRFKGQSAEQFAVDTIAGATVSSKAFISGVQAAALQISEMAQGSETPDGTLPGDDLLDDELSDYTQNINELPAGELTTDPVPAQPDGAQTTAEETANEADSTDNIDIPDDAAGE